MLESHSSISNQDVVEEEDKKSTSDSHLVVSRPVLEFCTNVRSVVEAHLLLLLCYPNSEATSLVVSITNNICEISRKILENHSLHRDADGESQGTGSLDDRPHLADFLSREYRRPGTFGTGRTPDEHVIENIRDAAVLKQRRGCLQLN